MDDLTAHLRLLGDATRLRILHVLAEEPLTVAELQELLSLSQSSVSGHLARLKRAGFLHDHAEGSAHRYRLREDMPSVAAAAWKALKSLSEHDALVVGDLQGLGALRDRRNRSWCERVAGSLHREYAPGRSWEAFAHAFLSLAQLGDCVDVGAGDGALVELLRPACRSLLCVEPNGSMADAGEERTRNAGLDGVTWARCGGERLPLNDAAADTLLFLQSLQYVPDPGPALTEAQRVLRPGGHLLVLTLAAHQHAEAERYGHQHRGFSPEQLRHWTRGLQEMRCLALTPEARAPRFVPLLFTARKP